MTRRDARDGDGKPPRDPGGARAARLSAALRANLRRRKAQTRAREAARGAAEADAEEAPPTAGGPAPGTEGEG